MNDSRKIIGWREWVSFPGLDIPHIKAKIDTGARSSCIHTASYELYEKDGESRVKFVVHPLVSDPTAEFACDAAVLSMRDVSDSGGHRQLRPFIRTQMRLDGQDYEIDVSLTNREGMKFRMLLGRVALADHFTVDCASSYLLGKKPSRSH